MTHAIGANRMSQEVNEHVYMYVHAATCTHSCLILLFSEEAFVGSLQVVGVRTEGGQHLSLLNLKGY